MRSFPNAHALMQTEALAERLGDPQVRLVDATFFVPPDPRTPWEAFQKAHLPGAVFFDIEAIADTQSPLPHMLPDACAFEEQVGALGIGNEDLVVVYDAHGVMSAPRVWWMFRVFGHPQVAVLDGGLVKWQQEGRPIEAGGPSHPPVAKPFRAHYHPEGVRSWEQVLANLQTSQEILLDARSAERFRGEAAEPRPGLRAGHVPQSYNLPWNELVDPLNKTLLPPEALRERFLKTGVDLNRPITCSCGSGITACLDAFALYLLGHEAAVYDGSWAEWGARGDLPIAPAEAL